VILFGHDELARPLVPQALIMPKELQIFGVFHDIYVPPAIRLLERGILPMDDNVSQVMPLDPIFEAPERVRTAHAINLVIDPSVSYRPGAIR
jgi:Zn-dependent alcohol dehydrogenase